MLLGRSLLARFRQEEGGEKKMGREKGSAVKRKTGIKQKEKQEGKGVGEGRGGEGGKDIP